MKFSLLRGIRRAEIKLLPHTFLPSGLSRRQPGKNNSPSSNNKKILEMFCASSNVIRTICSLVLKQSIFPESGVRAFSSGCAASSEVTSNVAHRTRSSQPSSSPPGCRVSSFLIINVWPGLSRHGSRLPPHLLEMTKAHQSAALFIPQTEVK